MLVRELHSESLTVSAYGLREGLLFRDLPDDIRAEDPLIAACREEADVQGRFPEHGELLDRWIAPLFPKNTDARLRLAAWTSPTIRCAVGAVGAMTEITASIRFRAKAAPRSLSAISTRATWRGGRPPSGSVVTSVNP